VVRLEELPKKMEQVLADKLSSVVNAVEQQLDDQIERLQNLGTDDLEKLREERLKKLKQDREQKIEWKALGHGEYSEVPEEKQMFEVVKKSKNVVCHFYRNETFRCKIVDKHLHILAAKHLETKFCKLNAEKCPFLTEKLKVVVLPSILLFQNAIAVDRIIGFTDLGNRDDFTTDIMEWRIAQKDIISYNGDKLNPPDQKAAKRSVNVHKAIRGGESDETDSSEDEDITGPYSANGGKEDHAAPSASGNHELDSDEELGLTKPS